MLLILLLGTGTAALASVLGAAHHLAEERVLKARAGGAKQQLAGAAQGAAPGGGRDAGARDRGRALRHGLRLQRLRAALGARTNPNLKP